MTDTPEVPEGLRPANENPWYVLMTLHGEQNCEEIDWELHEKNRRAWNAWAGQALSAEERAEAAKSSEIEVAELDGWEAQAGDIKNLFVEEYENRNPETDTLPDLPDPKDPIKMSKTAFSKLVALDKSVFASVALFTSATFAQDASFKSSTFTQAAKFASVTFTKSADFMSAMFTWAADFNSAKFTMAADFNSAKFMRTADFHTSTFEHDAIFFSAMFTLEAWFEGATFTQDAWFHSAMFNGFTDFN